MNKIEQAAKKAIEQHGYVIMMGTADWCGNCAMMKEVLTDLIKDGKVILVDQTNSSAFAEKYEIMSLPFFVVRTRISEHTVIGNTTEEELMNLAL